MASEAQRQAARRVKRQAERKSAEAEKDAPVSTVEEWRSGRKDVKLRLPSGNVCLARNYGIQPFVEAGKIPNSLMPLVMKAVNEGRAPSERDLADVAGDPQLVVEAMVLINEVVCRSVKQPTIVMPPAEGVDRRNDVLYADELDLDDKIFVFNWCVGGTSNLEQFRDEQAAALAGVADVSSVGSQAE